MKKKSTEQKYSMSDLVKDILKERNPRLAESPQWISDKKKNDVKKIHNILLPSLDLDSFIENYEDHKREPYNREWKHFFKCILDYDEKNSNESNLIRDDMRNKNHTIDNSLSTYKLEIFDNLLFAIAMGKTPEDYLKKLETTKLYRQGYVMWMFFILNKNIQNIISVADSYETYEQKADLINQITRLFNFLDGLESSNNIKYSINRDLMIPQNTVQNPELLLKTLMNPDFFVGNIAITIIKSNLKFIMDSFYSYVCIKYKDSLPEEVVKEIKDLNKGVVGIIHDKSLPCTPYEPAGIDLKEVIENHGIDYRKLLCV